jgi:N-acetylglucosaminyl-diphospho-decaprenol L-rhamnosyltransferase
MKLSVIIISFQSNHLIKKILSNFKKKHQIIIIENSMIQSTRKLEKKFQNTNVIIPTENLGYAKAFNLALKKCKNNFVLTITPDVLINKNLIEKIEKVINKYKKFTLLAPEYKNQKIYKNFTPFEKIKLAKKKINGFEIENVKEIDWCFCIINRKKFKNSKILDENFFMYFETIDLCKKLEKLKHKMSIIKGLKFKHLGTSSSNKKFNKDILLNRNWHFSWSKFYFFKKNQNYAYALRKIVPNIYQNILGIILSLIKIRLFDAKLHMASLMGALNGILLQKSSYRPNLNNDD